MAKKATAAPETLKPLELASVHDAIKATQIHPGASISDRTIRDRLFRLAQILKEEFPDKNFDPIELYDVVIEWHSKSGLDPHARGGDECFADFIGLWGRIKHPGMAGQLPDLLAAGRMDGAPGWASHYRCQTATDLAIIIREIARTQPQRRMDQIAAKRADPGENIRLNQKAIAAALGVTDPSSISVWLKRFREVDRAIEHAIGPDGKAKKGHTGRDAEYRYLMPLDE